MDRSGNVDRSDGRNSRAGVKARLPVVWAGAGVFFWVVVFVGLWIGAPWRARWLGMGWFGLGVFWPAGYFVSLAAVLPWFGNNPGGVHLLYLLDMGMMGLVTGHLLRRGVGWIERRSSRLDSWIVFFIVYSWICLIPMVLRLRCEWLTEGWGFLHRIYTHYGTAPVFGLRVALDLTLAGGLFAVLRDRPWPGRWRRWFWGAALTALVASAVAGLLDLGGVVSLEWWRGHNTDIMRFGYPRLQSLFWHSGWYAQYVAALAPALLAFGLVARGRAWRCGLFLLAGLMALVQMLTMQRGGWMALIAGFACVVTVFAIHRRWWGGWRRRLGFGLGFVVAFFLLLGLVLFLAHPDFQHRVGELLAYGHRTNIWRAAWGLMRMDPIFGVGLGNYCALYRGTYMFDHPFALLDNVTAHNTFLHIWVERGMVGLILFAVILGVALRNMVRPMVRPTAGGLPLGYRLAVVGGMTGLGVYGVVQHIFYVRLVGLLFWFFIGMSTWTEGRIRGWGALRWIRRIGMILLFGVGIYFVGDFLRGLPYLFAFQGRNYHVGGQVARVPVPVEAERIRLPLAVAHAGAGERAVTLTLRLDGRVLEQVRFREPSSRILVLDLPEARSSGEPLWIEASSTWSPYRQGLKAIPIMEMGVLWQRPVPAEDRPSGSEP